jgi:hypothetical protein
MIIIHTSNPEAKVKINCLENEGIEMLQQHCMPCVIYINGRRFMNMIRLGEKEFVEFWTNCHKICRVKPITSHTNVVKILKTL